MRALDPFEELVRRESQLGLGIRAVEGLFLLAAATDCLGAVVPTEIPRLTAAAGNQPRANNPSRVLMF